MRYSKRPSRVEAKSAKGLQFGVRTMFGILTIAAFCLGGLQYQATNVRRAWSNEQQALDMAVAFGLRRTNADGTRHYRLGPQPKFWYHLLAKDCYFVRVVDVHYHYTDDPVVAQKVSSALSHFNECRTLRLYGAGYNDESLSAVKSMPHLTSLTISSDSLTSQASKQLHRCEALENLTFHTVHLRDSSLYFLRNLTRLQRLHLSGRRCIPECESPFDFTFTAQHITNDGVEHLRGLRNLTFLDLSGSRIDGNGLAALRTCQRLDELILQRSHLSDADLGALQALPQLKSLDLGDSKNLSNAGMSHLRTLKGLKNLKLDGIHLDDDGIHPLKELPNLECLNLGKTKITDEGLRIIAEMKRLEEVQVYGTAVTEPGVAKLQADRPQLKIRSR